MNRFFGVTLVILALAIGIVPAFTDCQSQGKVLTVSNGNTVPMKCHWTGVAEIGVAVPLVAVGGMMTLNRRKHTLASLGIIGLVLGGLAIAFPAGLIGVCQAPTMMCHTTMQPTLTALGSLVIAGSTGTILLSRRAQV